VKVCKQQGLVGPSAQEPHFMTQHWCLFLGSVSHPVLAVLAQCYVALCAKATSVKLKLFLMFQIQNHWTIVQLSSTQANEAYICMHL